MNRFRNFPAKTFLSAAASFASLVAILLSQSVCSAAVRVIAADEPPSPKSAAPDGTSTGYASRPMIIQNPDGTFTVQKEPPNGNSKGARVNEGLVIPPQIVVPLVPSPEKKPKIEDNQRRE
jgi:hypothetical protein